MIGNIMLFLLGMRDNLGVILGEIPFRFGEITMLIFTVCILFKHRKGRLSIRLSNIIFFLSMHLIICLLSVFLNGFTNASYIAKYITRCILVISFYMAVNHYNVKNIRINFDKCFKLMIVIFYLTFIFEILGKTVWMCNIIEYSGHGFMGVNRYSGTASEPGYFLEAIVLPLYYYWKNNNKKMTLLCLVLAVMTFSVAVYAGIVLLYLVDLKISDQGKIFELSRSSAKKILFLVFFACFVIWFMSIQQSGILKSIYEKGLSYISGMGASSSDYSTMVRSEIKSAAMNELSDFSFTEWMIGKGLGGFFNYSYNLYSVGQLFHYGESPDNVYLGVLFDSGILGLLSYVIVLVMALRIKPISIESKTLFCGIAIAIMHNFIVSGMWLYIIWVEIGLLFIVDKKDHLNLESDVYCEKFK